MYNVFDILKQLGGPEHCITLFQRDPRFLKVFTLHNNRNNIGQLLNHLVVYILSMFSCGMLRGVCVYVCIIVGRFFWWSNFVPWVVTQYFLNCVSQFHDRYFVLCSIVKKISINNLQLSFNAMETLLEQPQFNISQILLILIVLLFIKKKKKFLIFWIVFFFFVIVL